MRTNRPEYFFCKQENSYPAEPVTKITNICTILSITIRDFIMCNI